MTGHRARFTRNQHTGLWHAWCHDCGYVTKGTMQRSEARSDALRHQHETAYGHLQGTLF